MSRTEHPATTQEDTMARTELATADQMNLIRALFADREIPLAQGFEATTESEFAAGRINIQGAEFLANVLKDQPAKLAPLYA